MANTYTQLHVQFVFAVQFRDALIERVWRIELEKYITGITTNCNQKMLSVHAMPDHLHMLVGMRPDMAPSQFMRTVKGESSEWINKRKLTRRGFNWQEGFGAFAYHKSMIPIVCNYIEKQEEHHRIKTFKEEYIELLDEFEIAYDERYIFRELE